MKTFTTRALFLASLPAESVAVAVGKRLSPVPARHDVVLVELVAAAEVAGEAYRLVEPLGEADFGAPDDPVMREARTLLRDLMGELIARGHTIAAEG